MEEEKTILITGGNDGIGKATAMELAKRGHTIILACRNTDKAEAAVKDIKKKSKNEKVSFISCDLASFDSIRQAASHFKAWYDKLDVLINNAGVFTSSLRKSEEGFELQFAVNHLGHFLLTHLLMDELKKSPNPRVVNVSSKAYLSGNIDFDNLRGEKGAEQYDGLRAYTQSKLANVLFTREMARRHPAIDTNALHPGVISTRLGNKNARWYHSLAWWLVSLFTASTKRGARTSTYLATSPEVDGTSGKFFDENQQQRKLSERARNEELAQRLWEESERMVAPVLEA